MIDDLRMRLTAIGHSGLTIMNPLSDAAVEELVGRLALRAGDRVLDLGCGKAGPLIRVVERYAVAGTGVEISPYLLAEARRATEGLSAGSVELLQADARAYRPARPHELVMALGPGWEHGRFPDLLADLRRHVAPGGQLLVADAYWRRSPTAAFLRLLGADRDEMASHEENVRAGIGLGLVPLWAVTASEQDWDRYEWSIAAAFARWLHMHAGDPIFDEVAAWSVRTRDRYLAGRTQLGFAAYLFRAPT